MAQRYGGVFGSQRAQHPAYWAAYVAAVGSQIKSKAPQLQRNNNFLLDKFANR